LLGSRRLLLITRRLLCEVTVGPLSRNHHGFETLENYSHRNSLAFEDVSKCQNCGDRIVRANPRRLRFLEFGSNGGYERENETGVAG
jgi:hypothetical protein